jgi:hypothetical protein
MRLRRGCGCPILILLVADAAFTIGAIITLVRGPSAEPVNPSRLASTLTLVVLAGNTIVCAILAMAALRRQALGQSPDETFDTEGSSEEESATDSEQDKADT